MLAKEGNLAWLGTLSIGNVVQLAGVLDAPLSQRGSAKSWLRPSQKSMYWMCRNVGP